MSQSKILGPLFAGILLVGAANAAQGPDINVLRIASNASDYVYYGQANGIAAYSMATTSCNPGTVPVNWNSTDHPVIGQNIFRLRDGIFEQLGQSWLKHGFCAVNEGGCGTCQGTPCSTLGVGCADTYWGTLNDGQGGGPKWQINPLSGVHTHPYPSPTGPSAIRGRLQVRVDDIDPTLPANAGAVWFAEGQYVSAHDAQAGNAANNNSWQKMKVLAVGNLQTDGPTHVGSPAVFGWRSIDGEVFCNQVVNVDEGGPGIHGYFWVASRAHDIGGTWRYVYTVQNLTSKQCAASISIPVAPEVTVSNFYFNDVDYHSGEPFDGTDWTVTADNGAVTFQCTQTHAQNPNANAIRWGTMYTFVFEANSPPQLVTGGEIGLFEPGTGSVLEFMGWLPGGEPIAGTPFCSGDGTGTFCPCLNFGNAGHGCANGNFFQGAKLSGTGVASASSDSVTLEATLSVPLQPGLFFQGDAQASGGAGVVFGDGLRCASTNLARLETTVSNGGGSASSTVSIAATGGIQPGDTKYYQYWYRDPVLSPCGAGFNLTNGLALTWAP